MKIEIGKHYLINYSLGTLMVVKYIRNANKEDMEEEHMSFADKNNYFIGEDVKYQYQYLLWKNDIISPIRID